jgi:hypothetical protein
MAVPFRVSKRLDIPVEAFGLDGTFDPDEVVHLYVLSQVFEDKGAQKWKADLVPSLDPDAPSFGSIGGKGPLEYAANALTATQEWVKKECGKKTWKMRVFSCGFADDCKAPDRPPWTTASVIISREH